MSNFWKIEDEELDLKLKNLARDERKILNEILIHIGEVDRRKLFLRMGFPSLYEYLVKEIGYSAGSAQRRIDAARLSVKVPEVLAKIQNGSLNLSQISKVQQAIRLVKKETGVAVRPEIQREVLEKLQYQSSAQTDLVLARQFQFSVQTQEKVRIQQDESVRLELTLTKEEMALINEARAFLSNKTGGALKDTILELARKVLKKPKILQRPEILETEARKSETSTATVAVNPKDTKIEFNADLDREPRSPHKEKILKSITPKRREEILKRDKFCQFQDPKTGRMCGSKFYLEVDHIRSRWLGGGNEKKKSKSNV